MTSRGFVGGRSSSSTWKRHLSTLKTVHLVKKKFKSMSPITFKDEDFKAPNLNKDDPMVITTENVRYEVSNVLIDNGSL